MKHVFYVRSLELGLPPQKDNKYHSLQLLSIGFVTSRVPPPSVRWPPRWAVRMFYQGRAAGSDSGSGPAGPAGNAAVAGPARSRLERGRCRPRARGAAARRPRPAAAAAPGLGGAWRPHVPSLARSLPPSPPASPPPPRRRSAVVKPHCLCRGGRGVAQPREPSAEPAAGRRRAPRLTNAPRPAAAAAPHPAPGDRRGQRGPRSARSAARGCRTRGQAAAPAGPPPLTRPSVGRSGGAGGLSAAPRRLPQREYGRVGGGGRRAGAAGPGAGGSRRSGTGERHGGKEQSGLGTAACGGGAAAGGRGGEASAAVWGREGGRRWSCFVSRHICGPSIFAAGRE